MTNLLPPSGAPTQLKFRTDPDPLTGDRLTVRFKHTRSLSRLARQAVLEARRGRR